MSDSVTNIGDRAFCNCTNLTSVTIPDGVTSIGSGAFNSCSGLTSVTMPDSVTNIGDRAFYNCTKLASVTISDGVTSIGDYVFQHCCGLTSVTIPDSVTSIGYRAFSDCSGLMNVRILNGVTKIGSHTFYNCTNLMSVTFWGNAPTVGTSAFSSVNPSCVASVSLKSTGWGVGVGEKWNGLTLQHWPETLIAVASDAEVGEIVATFADTELAARVSTMAEYDAFKAWVNGNNLYQPDVVANTNTTVSYLLGAERLFERAPTIEIGDVSVDENGAQETGTAINVAVIVKDGEDAVKCATEKVAGMFEATSDLGDWDGVARLAPAVTVEGSDGTTMRFKVTPDDGSSDCAFLRVKVK